MQLRIDRVKVMLEYAKGKPGPRLPADLLAVDKHSKQSKSMFHANCGYRGLSIALFLICSMEGFQRIYLLAVCWNSHCQFACWFAYFIKGLNNFKLSQYYPGSLVPGRMPCSRHGKLLLLLNGIRAAGPKPAVSQGMMPLGMKQFY